MILKNIMKLDNNNSQNEYYLTDVMSIIKKEEKCEIDYIIQPKNKQYETIGINTKDALEKLERDLLLNKWIID